MTDSPEARISLLEDEVNELCRLHGEAERYRLADPVLAAATAPSVASSLSFAENGLLASEAFNRSIIESSVDCIKVLDLEGNLLAMPNGQRVLGIDCIQPFLNTSWLEFWTGDDRLAAQAAVKAAAAGGTQSFVGFFRTRLDEARWWDVAVSPIWGTAGKPESLLVMSRDVTARKQAEDVLRQRIAQFETLFDEAPVGIYMIDADFRIRHVNPEALSAFGNIADLIGRDLAEVMRILWPKAKADETIAQFRQTMETGAAFHVAEMIEKRADRQQLEYYEWQISRIELPDGSYGVVCYFRDISQRFLAQEQLRKSEERFRALVTASSDVVYRMSPDWREMRQLHGQDFLVDTVAPNDEWLEQYIHSDDQQRVMAVVNEAIRTKSLFEMEHQVRLVDGSLGWTFSHAIPVLDATGEIVEWFGTASDVTEYKRAEQALRDSEHRYRNLFNSMDEGYCIIEVIFDANDKPVDYVYLEVNPSFEALTGMHGALGKRIREIIPDLEEYWFETYGKVALTGQAVRVVNEAKPLNRWFDVYAFRFGGVESRKVAVLFTNITERKQAERQLLEQATALADQDRRKNEFLAMLGPELRNPLAAISNAIQLLRLQGNEGPVQLQARTVIERQVGQLNHLVDDLLEVSRISTGRVQLRREQIAIGGVVERAVETVQPLIAQRRHQLTVALPTEPLWLHADAARLEQVIVNLLTNAAKYTDEGGRIDLSVQHEGESAVLRLRDTGIGITPDLLPHIFELFTQDERALDRSQGGLGIGLCLVQRLVELHGGSVAAQSAPGQGSEFVVRLPLAKALLPMSAPKLTNPPQPPGKPCRILVVDDNIDAAETLEMLLEVSGHEVRMAHEGFSAIDLALAWQPDVMLLDIGLPGLSGFELAKRIRLSDKLKSVVLIALTGYGQESDRQLSRQAGFDHHLVKPANFGTLEKILDSVATGRG